MGDLAAAPSGARVDSSRNGSASSSLSRAAVSRGGTHVGVRVERRTHARATACRHRCACKPWVTHRVRACCRCVARPAVPAGTLPSAVTSWPPLSHAALHPGCPLGCSGGRTWADRTAHSPCPRAPAEGRRFAFAQGTFSLIISVQTSVMGERAHGLPCGGSQPSEGPANHVPVAGPFHAMLHRRRHRPRPGRTGWASGAASGAAHELHPGWPQQPGRPPRGGAWASAASPSQPRCPAWPAGVTTASHQWAPASQAGTPCRGGPQTGSS